MSLESDVKLALAQPLDPHRVTVGNSGPLRGIKYLEGEDVIRTANRIFGYGEWGFSLLSQPWVIEEGSQGSNHTKYQVWAAHGRLMVSGGGSFADVGTCVRQGDGSGGLEMAIKGAVTDCMKRCLRNYGDQFGLILYDKTTDMAGLAAEYRNEHPNEPLPPVDPAPAPKVSASKGVPEFWPHYRQLMVAKHIPDSAVEAVIGTGPTMAAVEQWLNEHPDVNFTQLVRLAEEAKGQLMGAR